MGVKVTTLELFADQGERADGRGDIGTLAEGVGLDGHGLALGKAGFLDRKAVEEYAADDDVVDRGMHEDVGRRAAGALGGGGDGDHAGSSGSAGGESGVPAAGAGHAVGGDIQDRSVAGGER